MDDTMEALAAGGRMTRAMERIERVYLRVLRAAILIVATILLAVAAIGAAVALYKIARSPASVVERPSSVVAEDLIEPSSPSNNAKAAAETPQNSPEQRRFYDAFVKRYFAIFQSGFQRFQRAEDKKLTVSEFDDLTINSVGRLRAIAAGELSFDTDRADVENYLKVLTTAADLPATRTKLESYQRAKKGRVASQVQRNRYESRRGWDTYSESCESWYEAPVGCAVTRQIAVPYSETVYTMRYPDGLVSPTQVLKGYQDRYFSLLAERRAGNADAAAMERRSIVMGQTDGRIGLGQVATLLGAFLALMFFFLLIAIERHQRRLATEVVR